MKYWILAALALAGCNQKAADGYTLEKTEYNKTALGVGFVDYPDQQSFNEAARRFKAVKEGKETLAFSRLFPYENRCEIHILDPLKAYHPELIGHEIAHCRYGRFHS